MRAIFAAASNAQWAADWMHARQPGAAASTEALGSYFEVPLRSSDSDVRRSRSRAAAFVVTARMNQRERVPLTVTEISVMTTADHEFHSDTYIARALAVVGGHLQIGRGGYSLHYAQGATLSGYDCDAMKEACIAAGLPVIDSRNVAFAVVVELAVHGPMAAVGRDPDPQPWHMFSCAPLEVIAAAYARAGADVRNIGGIEFGVGMAGVSL